MMVPTGDITDGTVTALLPLLAAGDPLIDGGNSNRATATPDAPWYVVPADNKWFTRLVVAAAVVTTLEELDLRYPKLGKKQLAELAAARAALEAESA